MITSGRCHGPGCTWSASATEPVKLTAEQWGDLRARLAPLAPEPWWRGGAIGDLTGVPIELVDTVEESTPYLMAQQPGSLVVNPDILAADLEAFKRRFRDALRESRYRTTLLSEGAAFPLVASKDPQVGWFRRWLDRLTRRGT